MTPRSAPGAQGPPASGEPAALPGGAELRRWTARRTRRHHRGARALIGDVYTGLFAVALVGAIMGPYLRRMVAVRPGAEGAGRAPAGVAGVLDLDLGWLILALTMGLLALALGPLGRLGPLFLRPHEAAWWLPIPGDRRTLLLPVARIEYAIAAASGLMVGVVPALVAGGGWMAAVTWPALLAALFCLVLSGLIEAQVRGRGTARLRAALALLGTAACAAGALVPFPRSAPGNVAVAAAAGGLTALCLLRWRRVRPVLGDVHDAALLDVVARSFGAHVSLLSLDTRAVGRLLSPAPSRPESPARLRLARLAIRLPTRLRPVVCVAQADWLLMRRQPRRLLQMGAGLIVALLPALFDGASGPLRAVVHLVGGWVATLAVAEPARQAWFDGAADASWPAPPSAVRAGHLLVPTALMSTWSLVSLAPTAAALGADGAWRAAGLVVALAPLSGAAWAGAALRSGFRARPDFSAGLVASPMGSLPPGLVQMLTAGPDAALVGGSATALVACSIIEPSLRLLGLQTAAGAVVVLWGIFVNRRGA